MKKTPRSLSRRLFLAWSAISLMLAGKKARAAAGANGPESIANARRVVTEHDAAGRSVFRQTGPAPRVITTKTLPGFAMVESWATDQPPTLPVSKADPSVTMESFVPPVGGTRFRIVEFPAQSGLPFDSEAFHQEFLKLAPGLAESEERENPGMHTTDSVDYGIVISGEIILELDDGATVHLKQTDCVVQNGTRHRWRNPSRQQPCVMAFVLVGATRKR
jgi:mannose-6-phosphate isomerase-like protein (cupin superfamily)